MDDPVPPPGDRELLAAELALGVLDGDALAAARRRLLSDPAFAEEVEAWHERLAAIALDAPDEAAPDGMWKRIEAAIDAREHPAAVADLVPLSRLRRWQAGAVAAAGIAAALAVLLALPRPAVGPVSPPGPAQVAAQPAIVAELRGEGEGPVIFARYDPASAGLRLVAHDMGESDLAPELWVIPDDGVPRSLGLIASAGDTRLTVAQGHRAMMKDGATLAITMEPRATAPHAAPSGPPVASGKIFGI
ncbi:hypothetical protein FPZ54_03060 [Sphingomonas suaedae]|uniref:Anti-sigma K factor RskA C-terminal domain-containing protein n=1 Tax=Sphingomonas suaedae TaxID=2599297 RepID=A0A518RCA2_9SPHN|nr:hypothetical protein FPZ54_03060 [Sphingomonas suaedae]